MTKRFLLITFFWVAISPAIMAQVNFVEHIIGTQADGAHFVAIADMDNDGDMDIVSSSEFDSDLRLYPNNGNQVFGDQILTWVTASNLIITDFDDDSDRDIFTTCGADGTISWFRNLGSGFNTAATYNEGVARSAYLILADIDQDDDLDIISARDANVTNGTLSWLENDGYNQFSAQQAIAPNTNVEKMIAVDINNDGFPELITVADGAVKWYANNAGNIATTGTLIDNTVSARTIDAADFNADGFVDIVVGSLDFNKPLAWYPNNGGTTFGTFRLISGQFDYIHDVKVADLDGDGDVDVVGSDSEIGHKIVWFANNGSGTFGILRTVNNDIASPHGIAVGDIDDDGDLDIAATSSWDDQVIWYENQIPAADIDRIDPDNIGFTATWHTSSQQLNVAFTATQAAADIALISLYSADGKQVARQTMRIEAGQNQWQMTTGALPHGIYFAQLQTPAQVATVKLLAVGF